ncbi:MAG: uroporphyrinogen decarboxylase family protein [Eubacteriales bacterium]|nr:uroporphyrinogen decarboxylase family protein [Eubacteriales bacterium]
MLTAKQNLIETIRGGKPDRFVNQYEALHLMPVPHMMHMHGRREGNLAINAWGVASMATEGTPGFMPVHTPERIVVKDIENWREYVRAPKVHISQEEWDGFRARFETIDRTKAFAALMVAPGLFEQTHNLCSMVEALVNYIDNPQEMHDLIRYLTDWELEIAEEICTQLHPEAIFHHDDWGTEDRTFLRPEMFAEFFVEPYKQIYSYYHDHGVQLIVHHCDSYAASLVPYMIEMGIDIWQGCMHSNDLPELISKYGGKISFMGEIDNKQVDFTGWSEQDCRTAAQQAMQRCGRAHFIPCITQGLPGSVYPGAYAALAKQIDSLNSETFGYSMQELEAQRMPLQIFG